MSKNVSCLNESLERFTESNKGKLTGLDVSPEKMGSQQQRNSKEKEMVLLWAEGHQQEPTVM